MDGSLEPPPRRARDEADLIRRRQRGRNLGLLVVLATLAALFYAITIVKMGSGMGHGG